MKHTLDDYRQGGEGFALWAEEHCRIPVYPEGMSIPIFVPLVPRHQIDNPRGFNPLEDMEPAPRIKCAHGVDFSFECGLCVAEKQNREHDER